MSGPARAGGRGIWTRLLSAAIMVGVAVVLFQAHRVFLQSRVRAEQERAALSTACRIMWGSGGAAGSDTAFTMLSGRTAVDVERSSTPLRGFGEEVTVRASTPEGDDVVLVRWFYDNKQHEVGALRRARHTGAD